MACARAVAWWVVVGLASARSLQYGFELVQAERSRAVGVEDFEGRLDLFRVDDFWLPVQGGRHVQTPLCCFVTSIYAIIFIWSARLFVL